MKVVELAIPGAYLLESPVWGDERGFFREWFTSGDLSAEGIDFEPRQANFSFSARDVVRGLHYSLAPEGQSKLVTCVAGEVDDVIVDIRTGSPTFGRHELVHLTANAPHAVLLPGGAAHGFVVRSESAGLAYLLSSPYNAPLELEIDPFDGEVGIAWDLRAPAILSDKDRDAPSLEQRRRAGELPAFA